jgi:hypothetical protein
VRSTHQLTVHRNSAPVLPCGALVALIAAAVPCTTEYVYVTTGPGFQSSRTEFVSVYLGLLILVYVLGAAAPWPRVRLALRSSAFGGPLAFGATSFAVGLFFLLAAVPAAIAVLRAWNGIRNSGVTLAITVRAAAATIAVFLAGLYFTHL